MPDSSPSRTGSIDGVYERMRHVAKRLLADERSDHTLQPTALVHEAWLRLAQYRSDHELSTAELEALTSHVMRRVLTDHARHRHRAKRGANAIDADVDVDSSLATGARVVVGVDDALTELHRFDPELAQLVELRFFGGLTLAEIAEHRGCSLRTTNRHWQLARAWLLEALSDAVGTQPGAQA